MLTEGLAEVVETVSMQDRIKLEPDMSTETVLRRSIWRDHSSLQDYFLTSAVCSRLLLPWAPFRAPRRLLEERLVVL